MWLKPLQHLLRCILRLLQKRPVQLNGRNLGCHWLFHRDLEVLEDRITPGFADPHPSPGDGFGTSIVPLSTGNVVITAPEDNAGGTDAGAIYLFNGSTDALISTLIGSTGDHAGSGGVTALTNGNYVVASPDWSDNTGAVTWGNGTTGEAGTISQADSLVGSNAGTTGGGDCVGSGGVTALTNGNYVVASPDWSDNLGAATWGNGTIGAAGSISEANSLVGLNSGTYGDRISSGGVTALPNGNFVVSSPDWFNPGDNFPGAMTWGNGLIGVSGAVTTANSLVAMGAAVGGNIIPASLIVLPDDNYLMVSPFWGAHRGAVTWANGTTGVVGTLSSANSLVGQDSTINTISGQTIYGDAVGSGGVTVLADGNYVIDSPDWSSDEGAVTWATQTTGLVGIVSAANSLIGVGQASVTDLSNGDFQVPLGNSEAIGSQASGFSPTVMAVSPMAGPTAGGTTVTITVANLITPTAVDFGSTPGKILSYTATQIVATSPTGAAGTVDITVTNADGTSIDSSADEFTYAATPAVSGLSPAAGFFGGGTTVTITGTNLANATAVNFGDTPGDIVSDAATQLVVISPAESDGTVNVTVTTAGGTSPNTPAEQFLFVPFDPSTSTVSLSSGSVAAGAANTVTFQARDADGNPLDADGLTVAFELGNGTGQGTFGSVIDNGNGTYTATFIGTIAGSNTITANVDGVPVTSSSPSITVTPGSVSLATSVVELDSATVTSGTTDLVTLQAEDAYGNDIITGGLTVSFGLNVGIGQGTFGTVTDNGNGTYTANLTGTIAGTNAVTATIGGSPVTSTAPTFTVTPGPVSLETSFVTVSQDTDAAGTGDQVTLLARDAAGNNITTGGLTVTFTLVNTSGGQGTFGAVTDNGNGTYTATFTGTIAGTNDILATIGGNPITTSVAPIAVIPGSVSLANSYVTLASGSVASGDTDMVTLHAVDAYGNPLTAGGLEVGFNAGSGTATGSLGSFSDNNNGTYTELFTGILAGTNTITGAIGEQTLTSTAPTIMVAPSALDPANAVITLSAGSVASSSSLTVTVQTRDAAGNDLTTGGATVALALGSGNAQGTFGTVTDNGNGAYTTTFTGTIAGNSTITAKVNGISVSTTASSITVTPGALDPANAVVTLSAGSVASGDSLTATVQTRDAAGNDLSTGGATVTLELGAGNAQGRFGTVSDHGDGTYAATFMGTIAGTNAITAVVDGQAMTTTSPTVSVSPGVVVPANSLVLLATPEIQLDGVDSITLRARDAYGNDIDTSSFNVAFAIENKSGAKGTISKVKNNENGTYTANFTDTSDGSNVIVASVNGVEISSTAPITVAGGAFSTSESTVKLGSSTIVAGTSTTVTIQVFYPKNNPEPAGGLSVIFKLGSTSGGQGTFSSAIDNGNGTYTATFTGTLAGRNTIRAFIDGKEVTSTAPVIDVVVGSYSLSKSVVTVSHGTVPAGGMVTATLQLEDAGGNKLSTIGLTVVFTLGGQVVTATQNQKTGTFSAMFAEILAGSYTIVTTINSQPVTSKAPTVAVTPAALSLSNSSMLQPNPNTVELGRTLTLYLQTEDQYGNDLTTDLLSEGITFALGSKTGGQGTFGKLSYLGSGKYQVTFTAGKSTGNNTIYAIIGGKKLTSQAEAITVT